MTVQPETRRRWPISDVLARTDLAALLNDLAVPAGPDGAGRRWHCPVPEQDDRHASVSMFRDTHGHERWRCWSGDHRGDAIDLVMLTGHQPRGEAIEWLANRAGLTADRPSPIAPKPAPASAAAAVMSPLVERYVTLCEETLHRPAGRPILDYLHGRGLSDDTIRANRLGADLGRDVWRRERGLPYGAGPAAVFPAFGMCGDVTYVQARYLNPDEVGRKYENPTAALAPHPRVSFPKTSGDRHDVLLVCEGIPDALTASQAGFRTVALLGAQTPDPTVATRIATYATHSGLDIALVVDPDPAGLHVASVLSGLLEGHGFDLTVINPPDGMDLNDWANSQPDWAADVARRLEDRDQTLDLEGLDL